MAPLRSHCVSAACNCVRDAGKAVTETHVHGARRMLPPIMVRVLIPGCCLTLAIAQPASGAPSAAFDCAAAYDGSLLVGTTWTGPVTGTVERGDNNDMDIESLAVGGILSGVVAAFRPDKNRKDVP